MDKFTGIRALKRTIELILQKVNKYQEAMNEMSREELIELMAENNLDLSWIASQESVNQLSEDLQTIVTALNDMEGKIDRLGRAMDPYWEYTTAPSGEIDKWNHNIDDTNKTVTLNGYIGTDPDVEVYSIYKSDSDGAPYQTVLSKILADNSSANNVIKTLKVDAHVTCNTTLSFKNLAVLESYKFDATFQPTLDASTTAAMFKGCAKLKKIDFTDWNVPSNYGSSTFKYNTAEMFDGCSSLENVSGLDKVVKYMSSGNYMFRGCSNLKNITLHGSKSFEYYEYMFADCINLEVVNMQFGSTSKFRSTGMFTNCPKLTAFNIYKSMLPSGLQDGTALSGEWMYGSSPNVTNTVTTIGETAIEFVKTV